MKWAILLLGFGSVLLAPAAVAQEGFPNIEYINGKAGFPEKIKGQLILTPTELSFTSKDGAAVFSIPLSEVKDVSNSVEENPGSTGRKLLLGIFANKKEEFVYITTETAAAAEALVFKTKNKMSPGIVAKIRFQVKKTAGSGEPPISTAVLGDSAVDSTSHP
jgi:hypothetical protein